MIKVRQVDVGNAIYAYISTGRPKNGSELIFSRFPILVSVVLTIMHSAPSMKLSSLSTLAP